MLSEQGSKNFGAYLDRTLRVVRLDLFRRFKEIGVDMTPEQWIIISSLYKKNGQSQSDLGALSFKNAPTISRIIDLLCEKGLTVRERFDGEKRRYKVVLTEKGVEMVEQILPEILISREEGWEGLSDEDYNHFMRILNQIFENLKAKN
ncbi:MAG: winged helix-turn-helix transcriptional regulator [Bacteroidetes bacterium]|nr:winged helix-turn-helix transcriptional regulator [Bacteroidota bacterium]